MFGVWNFFQCTLELGDTALSLFDVVLILLSGTLLKN